MRDATASPIFSSKRGKRKRSAGQDDNGVKESHRDPAGAMSLQTIRLQEANEVVTPAGKEVRRRYSLESSGGSITKLSLGPAAKDDELLDEDDQSQIKKICLRKVSSLDEDDGGVQSIDDAGGEQDRGDQEAALDVGQGSSARKKKDVNQNRKGNDFTPNSVITQKFKLRFRTIFITFSHQNSIYISQKTPSRLGVRRI